MEDQNTIIAKLLPVKGEIQPGSRVVHKDFVSFDGIVESISDGIAIVETFEEEECSVEDLFLVGMCAVETDFQVPLKLTCLKSHAFAKYGQQYKLKKERERGKDNFVVIVKGFETVGDFYKKAKADDKEKPLWIKKGVFGINLGQISEKAKFVTDGMSINIKTTKGLLGFIEPKFNKDGRITVQCDRCESYH